MCKAFGHEDIKPTKTKRHLPPTWRQVPFFYLDFFIPQKALEQARIIAGTMRNVINVDSITQNAVYADIFSCDNIAVPIPKQRFVAGK